MASNLVELTTILARKVKDESARFTTSQKNNIILEAVKKYSVDKPLLRDDDQSGNGSTQTFATPSAWVDKFSIIKRAESPVDQVPPALLRIDENPPALTVVQVSNVEKIQTPQFTMSSGESMRIFYLTPHSVDASSSTLPAFDEDAVVNYAAHLLCKALAAFYAESTDSSIAADVVNHESKTDRFLTLADGFLATYVDHIEQGDVVTPTMQFAEQDVKFSWGSDLITHPSRNR